MNPERAALLAEDVSSPEPGQIRDYPAPRLAESLTAANSAPVKNNRWGASRAVAADTSSSRPRESAMDASRRARSPRQRSRSRDDDDWGTAATRYSGSAKVSQAISIDQLPSPEAAEDDSFPWGSGARSFGANLSQRLGPPKPDDFYSWGSETDPTSQPASPDAPPGFQLEDSPPINPVRRNDNSTLPSRPRSPSHRQQSRARSPRPRSPRPRSPGLPTGPRSMPDRPFNEERPHRSSGGWEIGTTSRPTASTSFEPYHAEDHAWGDAPAPEAGPSHSSAQNTAPVDSGWGWEDVPAIAPVNASTAKRPVTAASGGWGEVDDDPRASKRSRQDSGYARAEQDNGRSSRPAARSRGNSPHPRDETNHYRSPGAIRSRGRSRSRSPPPAHRAKSKSRARRSDSPQRRAPRSGSRHPAAASISPPARRGRSPSRHRRRSPSASPPPQRRRSRSRTRRIERDDHDEDRGRGRRHDREDDARSTRGVSRPARNKSLAPDDSQSQRGASVFPPARSTYGGSNYSPSHYAPSRPGSPTAPSIFGSRKKTQQPAHPFRSCGLDECTQCLLVALKSITRVTDKPLSANHAPAFVPTQPRSAPPTGPRNTNANGNGYVPTGPGHATTPTHKSAGPSGQQDYNFHPSNQPQSVPVNRTYARSASRPPEPALQPVSFGWGDEGDAAPRPASVSNQSAEAVNSDNPWGW